MQKNFLIAFLIVGIIVAIVFGVASFDIINRGKTISDLEWAEDIKKENFNAKTDIELNEMIISHEAKLIKVIDFYSRLEECPECVRYDITQKYIGYGLTAQELTAEVGADFNREVENKNFEVEKLRQSLERMKKEKELRANGFYVK